MSKYIEKLTDVSNLMESVKRLSSASGWKGSTQRFILNQLHHYNEIIKILESGNPYVMDDGYSFVLTENGKLRYIQSLTNKDMALQHTLTNCVLIPILKKYLIHDNGASLKGKGLSFTRKRLDNHLHKFYRKHKRNGYILKIDFKKYFDNIQHDILIEELKRYIDDEDVISLVRDICHHYEVDVSYSNEVDIINSVFNSLEYLDISKDFLASNVKCELEGAINPKRMMKKSLGIGSPVSQILGIFFPLKIDTFCKYVKGMKYYDAYMDDRIVISDSKDELIELLDDISKIAIELGIHINYKKTVIIPLTNQFTFLKTRYILDMNGKIIHKMPKDMITRERRKLKKLADIIYENNLDPQILIDQYKAWRGDKKFYNSHQTLKQMDKTFKECKEGLLCRILSM